MVKRHNNSAIPSHPIARFHSLPNTDCLSSHPRGSHQLFDQSHESKQKQNQQNQQNQQIQQIVEIVKIVEIVEIQKIEANRGQEPGEEPRSLTAPQSTAHKIGVQNFKIGRFASSSVVRIYQTKHQYIEKVYQSTPSIHVQQNQLFLPC